jgi:hypothetical protein
MLPAMTRTFRSVGAQFAAIFAYDMLQTAPYNLGWQTHFINLVHTPRQAVSAVIAGEAMRRLPAKQDYGTYPSNTHFGDFQVSYETDSSELNATDAYMNAGDTTTQPRKPAALRRVVGYGSSPLVKYDGTGAYFLDKVSDGVWRLEVYPDEVIVADPFAQPQPEKVVSRLYCRTWPMGITLPDLGEHYSAMPLNVPTDSAAGTRHAQQGTVNVEPGIWLLTKADKVDLAAMPAEINHVGFREYHVNAPQTYPDVIQNLTSRAFTTNAPIDIRVRMVSQALPDAVTVFIRPTGMKAFSQTLPMTRLRGFDFGVSLKPGDLAPGYYDFVVAETRDTQSKTYPGALAGRPGVWPFAAGEVWHLDVSLPETPLELFNPRRDATLLDFSRPEETHRTPYFRLVPGETSEEGAFDFGVPDIGADTPELYAAALYIGDAIAGRGADSAKASALAVRFRTAGGIRKTLNLTLIEKDGSGWRGSYVASHDWSTVRIPLQSLVFARSVLVPTPYPALWDFWRNGPAARSTGKIHPQDVERLELRVRRNEGETAADDASGVEIESVWLEFGSVKGATP